MDENQTPHPEQKPGEVFLTNAREWEWDEIPYPSKRRGNVAYKKDGSEIPKTEGAFPVFVRKEDVEQKTE